MTGAAVRAALAGATLAVVLVLPGAAAAHPGDTFVDVTSTGYDPDEVTIIQSQRVHWTWQPMLGSRSVTADPNPYEDFDSGPKSSGDFYDWVFNTPGTYTYRSEFGVAGMGTVTVLPYPTPPPKIKRLRVAGGSNPKAKFRTNVRGDAVCRVEARDGGWHTVRSFFKRASKGRNRLRIPDSALESGRHRLIVRLYDRFNRLDSARDAFRF